jgi:hypothetical protein
MKRRFWIGFGLVILFVLIFGGGIATFYTDWLWFGEVGYRSVFWTQLIDRSLLGWIGGVLFFAIVYPNLWLARALVPPPAERFHSDDMRSRVGHFARRTLTLVIFGVTAVASLLVGLEAAGHWLDYAMFTHSSSFSAVDPIFHRQIGFYIFTLPFLQYIYQWLFFTLIVTFIATAVVHFLNRAIDFVAGTPTFAPHVKAHLSVIFALALFLKAWGYYLDRFNLLYSNMGAVFGAGYTDIHARLPALDILIVVAIISGLLALVNIYRRGIGLPTAALVILVAASLLIGAVYPGIVQAVVVGPNQISLESRYIANDISATRKAFNLDTIDVSQFPAKANLTAADIRKNQATINSIRVWDYRPLQQTYSQLQALGQYYVIPNNSVDIDRYTVNGTLRQVMLAAREMSLSNAQPDVANWINTHFQYTHGYGVIMSPVNKATPEGLPEYFIRDMPPVSSVGLNVDVPQIYYGQETTDWAIVDSKQKEYDYPGSSQPNYTQYSGKGGIPVGNYLRRIAFAWRFGDLQMLLKNPISPESRILFHREVLERVNEIFPSLTFDQEAGGDPVYVVIADGKIYWIVDAYTTSSTYPYAKPTADTGINYIRNSVKVVVDAYNGTVNFYVSDPRDPIIRTYTKIFPGVFKPLSDMPKTLLPHIRYPEYMFKLQANMLATYHITNPQAFLTKADLWAIPNEIVGTSGDQSPIQPYYVVMTLPGETREQFLLMQPFTPLNRDVMVAWMAARCDPGEYGKMILYEFPKDQLVYGPAQIESRLNQKPSISSELTLWNQQGSKVNRGNLLVIPINQSLIYVKPLYLESESSKIPELKRVVVAYGDDLEMEPTLDAAIARIFGGSATVAEATATIKSISPGKAATPQAKQLIDQAIEEFQKAKELQQKGDWAGYGEQLNKLDQTLRALKAQGG